MTVSVDAEGMVTEVRLAEEALATTAEVLGRIITEAIRRAASRALERAPVAKDPRRPRWSDWLRAWWDGSWRP